MRILSKKVNMILHIVSSSFPPYFTLFIPILIFTPGYYCTEASNTSNPSVTNAQGGPCPVGSFCPEGSSLAQPCSPGTYAPTTQMSNCTVCPAGYYCVAGSSITVECPRGMDNFISNCCENLSIFSNVLLWIFLYVVL